MLIAVDLDDILADTLNSIIQFHNETYGTAYLRRDFISYHWEEVWGGTREQAIDKFFQFIQTPYFLNIPPIPGSYEGVQFLKKKHDVVVVTSRQHELTDATHAWINTHFPHVFSQIYITNHPHFAKSGKTKTKREVCDEINADVLIDDSIGYATECVTASRKIFLMNTPWNQGDVDTNVFRVNSWSDIISHEFWM